MVPAYDISRIEPNGSRLWREAVLSLEEDEARIAVLAASVPASYLIRCQRTGVLTTVTPGGPATHTKTQPSAVD